MSKKTFKKGDFVYLPQLKTYAQITTLQDNGQPKEVSIDGHIIEVITKVVEAVGFFKSLWLSIKALFKKKK